RYWETVQRLGITQFYGAPTALRLLLKYDESWVTRYDRSSLRTLGSVGEPINHEAWDWFYHVVGEGRCPLVDTWWQTETGGICIAPHPAEEGAPILPAMAMRPFYGVEPVLLGDKITGRMDDVINISGHRLGTAEIEDALDEHPAVPESAVIGVPHGIKGEVPFAFLVLKEGVSQQQEVIVEELRHLVVKRLPKTRSGKIMRRILRKVVLEQTGELGDVSTLEDPSIVMEIIQAHGCYKEQQ
ncbi:hypothetical protein CRUP_026932, partial [Coryphaenoides rupestris]